MDKLYFEGEDSACHILLELAFFFYRMHYCSLLEQVAKRSGGFLVPGDIHGQAGQGSEQPALAVGIHVLCREVV